MFPSISAYKNYLRGARRGVFAIGSALSRSVSTHNHKNDESLGLGPKSRAAIETEATSVAHNYHPLPVVVARAKGESVQALVREMRQEEVCSCRKLNTPLLLLLTHSHPPSTLPHPQPKPPTTGAVVWDVDGRQYYDWLSAYSAVNFGHAPQRVISAMMGQAQRVTLTSRAFFNDQLGPYAQDITQLFGYDKVLPMNTGVEACETAVKLARKWGHMVKGGVKKGDAKVLFCHGNFWGRSIAAVSSSDDPSSFSGYEPLVPGFKKIPFGDAAALDRALASDHNIVAFMVEPIQGEAGVIVPPPGYLTAVREICTKHNVLFIADEVQTGLGRTGKLIACHHEVGVRPDILILGKALGAGLLPVSAVLADDAVMEVMSPGTHGSTFGGNPLACAVARESLKMLVEEKLAEKAAEKGALVTSSLERLVASAPHVFRETRGKGLMQALELREDARDSNGKPITAWDACLALRDAASPRFGYRVGLLTKPTHETTIRLAPPLNITDKEAKEALEILTGVLSSLADGKEGKGGGGR